MFLSVFPMFSASLAAVFQANVCGDLLIFFGFSQKKVGHV